MRWNAGGTLTLRVGEGASGERGRTPTLAD